VIGISAIFTTDTIPALFIIVESFTPKVKKLFGSKEDQNLPQIRP